MKELQTFLSTSVFPVAWIFKYEIALHVGLSAGRITK